MEVKGKIVRIGQVQQVSDKLKKLEFVIETNEKYPQRLQLEVHNDIADNFIIYNKVGQEVVCSINLRGNEWTNPSGVIMTFNKIVAWKVFKSDSVMSQEQAPQEEEAPFQKIEIMARQEYLEKEQKLQEQTGFEILNEFHAIAYIIVDEKDMIFYRDALKPHRGEYYE